MTDYGFNKVSNITGALEREHFSATMNILKKILKKKTLNLAFVIDCDSTWIGVVERIKMHLKNDPSIKVKYLFSPTTFNQFKKNIILVQKKVDAVGMLGVFRFISTGNKYVDYQTVLRWTVENSTLPDFSFWETRVERGTLCAVTVSGFEQGKLAGNIARQILINNIKPVSSAKGHPMVSLARAKKLGIQINTSLLLRTKVQTRFFWEQSE